MKMALGLCRQQAQQMVASGHNIFHATIASHVHNNEEKIILLTVWANNNQREAVSC